MSDKKIVRRKVIKTERTYGRVPGWLLDLDCGHFVEITGWGNGSGIAPPKTTICDYCSGRKVWRTLAMTTVGEPIPDELCEHVELGAEMTGGWYFAAREPPIAVGMCHQCMVWCREHFDASGQTPWAAYMKGQSYAGR